MEDIFTNLTKGYTDKEIKKDNIYQSGINELERTFPYKPEELSVKTIKLDPFYSNLFQSLISDEAEKRFEKAFYKTESKKNEENYQYTDGWPNKYRYEDIMQQIRGQYGPLKADRLSQQLAFVNVSSEAEQLYNSWKAIIPEKQFVELIKCMSGNKDTYFKRFDLFDRNHKTESKQRKSNEAIEDLNKFIDNLQDVIYEIDNVKSIETFPASDTMANNDGFKIHTNDGHSFQVVITQES